MTKRQPLPPLDEHSPIPILRIDGEGIVCAFNAAAAEAFGLTPQRRRRAVSLLPGLKAVPVADHIENGGQAGFSANVDKQAFCVTLKGLPQERVAQLYCVPANGQPTVTEGPESVEARDNAAAGSDAQLQQLLQSYQQQLKELSCIYGLAELLRTRDTIEEICAELVRLIPPAWRHPDWARAHLARWTRIREPALRGHAVGQSAAIVVTIARGMVQCSTCARCRFARVRPFRGGTQTFGRGRPYLGRSHRAPRI